MPDEISRLSAEVARNPAGRSSIALAEALRRARQMPAAAAAARRALERHPYDAEAHDVLARISADTADDATARDEWEMAVRLDSSHVPSLLGLSFLAYRLADREEARRRLSQATALAPNDPRVTRATALIGKMPAPAVDAPNDGASFGKASEFSLRPRTLFSSIKDDGAAGVLLVDRDGHVVAGDAYDNDGADVSSELGAELCGLSTEAGRALSQLGLGAWEHLSVECESTVLSIAPCADETTVLVATDDSVPMGMSRLLLSRARRRAASWLEAL
ncbi:MAG: roadblock/LC7 domain-containing protein [Gemmatimonadaceae bacterium]